MTEDQETEQSLLRVVQDLIAAVRKLENDGLFMPALILTYSSIDIVAALDRPEHTASTSGAVFKAWVTDYLLKNSELTCTAEEIWGARCGLLHTHTLDSDRSRAGSVRTVSLVKSLKPDVIRFIQREFDNQGTNTVVIDYDTFVSSFVFGVARFLESFRSDPTKRKRVLQHSLRLAQHFQTARPLGGEVSP